MSPPNDDSESHQDHSSLVQPQFTYHRFLEPFFAYSRAAYDYVQLPNSGIGYANEISALSTVFPGLYPFETINPSSFPTRSLDKTEDPSVSSVGEQDTVESERDTQSPNTPEAPSSSTPASQGTMFHSARNLIFQGGSFINNVITESRNENKSVLVIIAFICFGIFFLLLLGVYHRFSTADLSTNVFPDFPPRAEIYANGGDTMYVHSWSEAQNLMDLTYLVFNGKHLPTCEDVTREAAQLAFEIHTRVPVLPRHFVTDGSYLSEYVSDPYYVLVKCWPRELEAFSQALFISNFLDHRYILAVSRIYGHYCGEALSITSECYVDGIPISINDWRNSTDPSYKEMMFVMLNLARTIQYLYSMGFVLSNRIRLDDIYVDWGFHVRISPTELVWSGHYSLQEAGQRSETGIYTFGSVFCMIYFGTSEPSCTTSQATRTSLSKPELRVPGDVGQLIKQCLSTEDKPTIDEVVQEMESWKIRQDLHGLSGTCLPPFCTVIYELEETSL